MNNVYIAMCCSEYGDDDTMIGIYTSEVMAKRACITSLQTELTDATLVHKVIRVGVDTHINTQQFGDAVVWRSCSYDERGQHVSSV